MSPKWTYLAVDFFSFLFPFIFSFHSKIKFYKQWRYLAISSFLIAAFFIIWDIYFTYLGIWHFNIQYVLGYYFINLPIEEVLFFISIPYACVFTYYCIDTLTTVKSKLSLPSIFNLVLSVLLFITALIYLNRLYTSVTFLLLSCVLFIVYKRGLNFMGLFYFTYAFILIPFFITNGILTGGFFHRAVVIYNNNHNIGLRIGTIPVEDIFYGMLLLLLNVLGFQYLKRQIKILSVFKY